MCFEGIWETSGLRVETQLNAASLAQKAVPAGAWKTAMLRLWMAEASLRGFRSKDFNGSRIRGLSYDILSRIWLSFVHVLRTCLRLNSNVLIPLTEEIWRWHSGNIVRLEWKRANRAGGARKCTVWREKAAGSLTWRESVAVRGPSNKEWPALHWHEGNAALRTGPTQLAPNFERRPVFCS